MKGKKGSVSVNCTDGHGKFGSVISVIYETQRGEFVSKQFTGRDFYCSGATELVAGVRVGQLINFRLKTEKMDGPGLTGNVAPLIEFVENGQVLLSSKPSIGVTNWIEQYMLCTMATCMPRKQIALFDEMWPRWL